MYPYFQYLMWSKVIQDEMVGPKALFPEGKLWRLLIHENLILPCALCSDSILYSPILATKSKEGLPTSEFRLTTSEFWLLTSEFQLPTSDLQVPTSDFWLLSSEFWLPPSESKMISDLQLITLEIESILTKSESYKLLFLCHHRLIKNALEYNVYHNSIVIHSHLSRRLLQCLSLLFVSYILNQIRLQVSSQISILYYRYNCVSLS